MTQQSSRKVRGFVVDQQTGTPIPNVVLLFEAKSTDNNVTNTFPLGMLVTDSAGYASFDLTPFDIQLSKAIQVTPLGEEQSQDSTNVALVSQPESRIHFVLKVDQKRVKGKASVGLASIQNPDDIDRDVSPYSFTVKSALTLGEGDCQTPIPTPFALRDFRFGRVVLTTNQSVDDNLPSVAALDPTGGFWARDSTSLPLRVAEVLEFRQRWFPLGHSLGQIVYSVPLAPCESVNLAMIDWSREDTIRREDHVEARESLFHDQRRDRTIEETVGAALKESQTGFSLMGGYSHADSAGASATVPIYGIPVNLNAAASNLWSLGGAIAHTNGNRDITADSLQEIHDRVRQATSVVRTLNSTVVIQATQQEQNVIQTRTVTNHNHCHALTVQYYEVPRTFKIVTEFERRRRVLLIPYKMVSFGPSDWQLALRFETLLKAVLLDQSLAGCFEAIKRLHLCPHIYPVDDGEGTGTTPGKPAHKIQKYELTLTTGKAKEAWGRKFGECWGPVYVRLILKNGEQRDLFIKPNISDPGGFAFQYEQDYTVPIGFPSECVGLNPLDITQVSIRWMESNGDDAWGFKGIKIRYQLDGEDQLNYTLLDASHPIYLKWFDDPPAAGLFWTQPVSAPPVISPIEEPVITEELGAPGGHEQRPTPVSRKADECCEQRLLAHLNCNIGYYNRAIWLLQDPVERRILLEELLNGTGLTDLIDEMPVAVSGRYVAFPLDDPQLENVLLKPAVQEALSRLRLGQDVLNDIWNRAVEIGPREPKKPEPLVSYVSLPTRGLFAEAQLGHCNSCEVRDATRFWKWDESPCEKATPIEGITPGPKGQPPTIPQPASLPNPVVNVMQAPTAPDPVGLAAALKVLGTPDIFRDMSGLDEVSKLLGQLTSGAVTSLQDAQKIAKEAQDKLTKEKEKASSSGGGGAEKKQTPEERFDNLQVAKEAAKAAQELGWDDKRTADITSDIVSGGGGGFYSAIRRMVDETIKGTIPTTIPPEHPTLAEKAKFIADNPILVKAYENFQDKIWGWWFSPNEKLAGAVSKPAGLTSWSDWDGLRWQQRQTMADLAIMNAGSLARNTNNLNKLKQVLTQWPDNYYSVFQSGTTEETNTCNLFLGDALTLDGRTQLQANGKYYSAQQIYQGQGGFREVPLFYVSVGDIACWGPHVEIVTKLNYSDGTFCSRGGFRKPIGGELCEEDQNNGRRKLDLSGLRFMRVA